MKPPAQSVAMIRRLLFIVIYVSRVVAGCPPDSPALGSARAYAILGGTTVTNTGYTELTGDLGLNPGSSVTGFPPGEYSGSENIANTAAADAQSSALVAFDDLQGRAPGQAQNDLDALILSPGTYTSAATSMSLATSGASTLKLDAGGAQNATWIFQIGSTLTTGAGGVATIQVINGGCAANVYWQVGTAATINVTPGSVLLETSLHTPASQLIRDQSPGASLR